VTTAQSKSPQHAKAATPGAGKPSSPMPAESDVMARTGRRKGFRARESLLACIFLVIAVAFNLYFLYPEVAVKAPAINDAILHQTNLQRTADALAAGQDPTDHWLATIALGYPLFHHYQHLPYVIPALIHFPVSSVISLADLYRWTGYLLLSFFPLSIYWSLRRFGFAPVPSALAGLVSSLIATKGLFGLEYGTYVWRGSGLYTQLWGMFLLPLALARCYETLFEKRGYLWSVVLLVATMLSHVVLGYVALGSIVAMVFLGEWKRSARTPAGGDFRARAQRLLILLILVGLVAAYFVVPFLLDGAYMNRSVWEKQEKYDSLGLEVVLGTLAKGDLFDYGRFPSLTLLAGLGLALCLWRWRDVRYRVLAVFPLLWLLLYFGRPTWGALLDLLPASRDLHFHRLIAGVHLGSIFLMGIGLALPWTWALARRKAWAIPAAALLTALLLLPVYLERVAYLGENARWMEQEQAAFQAEEKDLNRLIDVLKKSPPGRVYAGLAGNWGKNYKVGSVPMYALLNSNGLDMVGYLYHALSLNSDIQALFDDARREQYNLFNIRYVVTPVGWNIPSYYKPLGDYGRHRLYQVETTGYFDVVSSDLAFSGNKQDFYPAASSWLKGNLPRAKRHPTLCLPAAPDNDQRYSPLSLAYQIMSQASADPGPARGSIISETVATNAYQAEVNIERDSMVMLKATYHPGWRATVDGVQVPAVMLMPSYIGVRTTPGIHQVRFAYEPKLLRGILMIVSMLTLIVLALAERWPGKISRIARRLRPQRRSAKPESGPPAAAQTGPTPKSGKPRKANLKTKIGIYLFFLAIYLMAGAGHFFSTDHIAVYLTAQSLIEDHSLAIKPINDTVQGTGGKYYARYQPGQSLLSIPFYLAGRFVESISTPALKRYFSSNDLGDWGGTVPIFFVSLFNQFVTPCICVLVFMFCLRLGFSTGISWLTTLVFGLGTSAWVYAREYFQHSLETLALLLAIYVLFSRRDILKALHAFLSGLAMAIGVVTRINVLVLAPVVIIYLLLLTLNFRTGGPPGERESPRLWRQLRAACRGRAGDFKAPVQCLLAFFLPLAAALAIILFHNYARFGDCFSLGPNTYDKGFSNPIWLGLFGYLFSPGRSIFLYSPPVLLALFTFSGFYRKFRLEAVLFLSITAIYLVLYSAFGYWHGGWSWGPRYLLPIMPLLVIPLGYFLGSKPRMIFVMLLAVLGIGMQILGVAVNYDYVYWDWIRMNLSPQNAFLFVPDISAIPTHLRALLAGRHIDLWLLTVYKQFGISVFLLTVSVPLLMAAGSFVLLKKLPTRIQIAHQMNEKHQD
jgi:hypothetical protein